MIAYIFALAYWVACLGSVALLIFYAASGSRKCAQGVGILLVAYLLVKGAQMAL